MTKMAPIRPLINFPRLVTLRLGGVGMVKVMPLARTGELKLKNTKGVNKAVNFLNIAIL